MSETMEPGAAAPRRRGRVGGRAANTRRASAGALSQKPFRQLRYRDAPVEPLSAAELETVLDAAYRILETIGVEMLSDEARDLYRRAGASVDDGALRVRADRDLIEAAMAHVPSRFSITPRNPARAIEIGGDAVVFSAVASTPNCSDLDRGRRPGTREDFKKFLTLSQEFNIIHTLGGYPVEPIDLAVPTRHLDAFSDMLLSLDKALHCYSLSVEMVEDNMEMARLAAGLSDAEFEASPHIYTNVNTNSPLKIDEPMMDGPLRMARRGQATIITPFTLAGAMAPVTVAAAVAQQTAEFLALAAAIQLQTPGAPVVMGGFVSNVDMRSGAPAFGTPEYMRGAQIGGQMARRLGVPFRASNVNAANAVDAQAAWESAFSLWGVLTGRVNYVHHGAGWLEGGLVASFEKFVVDCEMLSWLSAYLEPIDVSEDALGLSAMEEVGPGGHFFGCAHTQARYETAFHAPILSDWRNFQSWASDGSKSAAERANTLYKSVLETASPPPMDDGARGALEAFVEARRAEIARRGAVA